MSAGCVSAGRVCRQGAFAGRLLLPTLVWSDESATASEEAVRSVFIDQVRFIGAGVIAIAAVWTLIKILKPIAVGIREAAIAAGKRHAGKKVDLTERDIPIQIVGATIALLMLPIGFLLADFVNGTAIHNSTHLMVVSVAFILIIGLVVAAVCGYMAGLIGIVVIVVDETLKRGTAGRLKLPPLAVGMGMYLMPTTTLTIALGAVLGTLYDRWAERSGGDVDGKKRMGVLMSTGLIVGESLFGVIYAGIVGWSGDDAPLAVVGEGFATPAKFIGTALFAAAATLLYKHARVQAEK